MALIKYLNEISNSDAPIAGGKGASLGEMTQAGIPVPPGFVILSEAFDKFMEESNLNVKIDDVLGEVDIKETGSVENSSEKIRALILSKEMPEYIKKDILSHFKDLNSEFVAVRSSATSEDSVYASWAGQLDSFLNTTAENLLDNVKMCWASLFTPRAIFYSFRKGLDRNNISVAVVIQRMVDSEKSGIAFSAHPVTHDKNQIVIEAGFGLGEAIVSGSITPDRYVLDKKRFDIVSIDVNEKKGALHRKDTGNVWKELKETRNKQVLTKGEIVELSRLITKIESHYGFPCDIEWAKEGVRFYIIQSRPITTAFGTGLKPSFDMAARTPWKYYLGRPFSLFGASVWNYWYLSSKMLEVLGADMKDSLFVETHRAFVRNYRLETQLNRFQRSIADIAHDKERMKSILETGLRLNEEALDRLGSNKRLSIKEEADFLVDLAIHATVIPYWAFYSLNERDNEDSKLLELCEGLRAESLYPKIIKDIITPLAEKRLSELGIEDASEALQLMTLHEVLSGKIDVIKERKEKARNNLFFIYENRNGSETIEWTDNPGELVARLEHVPRVADSMITGTVAFAGRVTGRARLILTNDNQKLFHYGDILVATSTNPELIPLLNKASAIVTDEGGVMCHAAVIARELQKPCIVGTKVATSMIADGDLIEVDANRGDVRILSRAEPAN